MKAAIKAYYTKRFKLEPLVTLTHENASGSVVPEGDSDLYASIYAVEVPTALTEASVSQIMVVPMSTKSKVKVAYPTDVQLSDKPLSGKYYF